MEEERTNSTNSFTVSGPKASELFGVVILSSIVLTQLITGIFAVTMTLLTTSNPTVTT